jgi:hypothetical protein
MLAIILALQWVLEVKPRNVVICSDSLSCLTSFKSGKSESHQDLLDEVSYLIYGIKQQKISIRFTWVPAYKGILGNEKVDKLAKEAVKAREIEYDVPLSRKEIKVIIKDKINNIWQERWNLEEKGRHLYKIQKDIIIRYNSIMNRREEIWINRLRIGHTSLNTGLKIIGKHPTGNCTYCGEIEEVEHVLIYCRKYIKERKELERVLGSSVKMADLLGKHQSDKIFKALIKYLKDTELAGRI